MTHERLREAAQGLFTKLPRDDSDEAMLERAHVRYWELEDSEAAHMLIQQEIRYASTRNPVYAIEAFLLAHRLHIYPSPWVVRVLAASFGHWHDRNGLVSMDKALGLRSRGRGRRDSAFQRAFHADRDSLLILSMARLIALGATQSEASVAVAERLKATKNWNKSGWKLRALDDDQLKRRYREAGKPFQADVAQDVARWDQAAVSRFLSQFPSAYLPKKLLTSKAPKR